MPETYSNLTMKEKNELNNLRNNHSIIIKPSGKGNNISIMNTRDNLTKIHTHLQNPNTYKPLNCNPTIAIAHDVHSLTHFYILNS